jgi:hypothetical protein
MSVGFARSGFWAACGVVSAWGLSGCSLLGSSLDGYSGGEQLADATAIVDPADGGGDPDAACTTGSCVGACSNSQTWCGQSCADTRSDVNHCGTCSNACRPGDECVDGRCALPCSSGQKRCGADCKDVQTDEQNCGDCGTTCDSSQECHGGACVLACKPFLNQPITDPWGYSWDGLERAATTFAGATAACQQVHGRLPTASELYRVSATRSATVGQTIHVNPLWSLVPDGAGAHAHVKLSDASTATNPDSSMLNYRCVCPPDLPRSFTGDNCFSSVSGQNGCFGLAGEGAKRSVDIEDRAALTKGSALWECAFYHGHLASPVVLTETLLGGVRGSSTWLHTSDDVSYQWDAVIQWDDPTKFIFQYTGSGNNSLSWSQTSTLRPFRCTGTNFDAGTHPALVPNEWVTPAGNYKGELSDATASAWADAHMACNARGGHMASSAELGEMITAGLPNGSMNWIWTSDQTGYDTMNFLVGAQKWNQVETSHVYDNPAGLTWAYKHTMSPYRCVYYPIDRTYAGPTQCAGGCFAVKLGGTSGATMWFDNFDRAPAEKPLQAIDVCRMAGGHLASERDMLEAIRKGLPNGAATPPNGPVIFTSDLEFGAQPGSTSPGLLLGVVQWAKSDPMFDDLWKTYATWDWPYNPHPYRCMWTNELR